jgi:predicted RNase H-like HicB family nuclease
LKGYGQFDHPLSISTSGGKQKLNCANTEDILRIIQSVPSPKAEPFITVTVPGLPGLVTEGADMRDAEAMARDAIKCHLEDLAISGEEAPREGELTQMRLKVKIG